MPGTGVSAPEVAKPQAAQKCGGSTAFCCWISGAVYAVLLLARRRSVYEYVSAGERKADERTETGSISVCGHVLTKDWNKRFGRITDHARGVH